MRTLIFILVCCSLQAVSVTAILDRCNEQNLEPKQARLRNEWAARCFPLAKNFFEYFAHHYPIKYALVKNPKGSWEGPLDPNAPCGDWELVSFCVAACYTADQRVLFESGYISILDALESHESKLVTLAPSSTLANIHLKTLDVAHYTRSRENGSEIIREIQTQSGHHLKVTQAHPILLSSGVMVPADELNLGDYLLTSEGAPDPIILIEDKSFFGKVYNVNPRSNDPIENILVAEGLLVGSAAYQFTEELNSLMGRKFMRSLL